MLYIQSLTVSLHSITYSDISNQNSFIQFSDVCVVYVENAGMCLCRLLTATKKKQRNRKNQQQKQ